MASGRLASDKRPLIGIDVDGHPVEAVIDTGFDGGIQLPNAFFPLLNPTPVGREPFLYPNGVIEWLPTYRLRVVVDGSEVETALIFSPNDEVLIGTELLQHFRLTIDYPAGTVELSR